jgi:hypothetical protein
MRKTTIIKEEKKKRVGESVSYAPASPLPGPISVSTAHARASLLTKVPHQGSLAANSSLAPAYAKLMGPHSHRTRSGAAPGVPKAMQNTTRTPLPGARRIVQKNRRTRSGWVSDFCVRRAGKIPSLKICGTWATLLPLFSGPPLDCSIGPLLWKFLARVKINNLAARSRPPPAPNSSREPARHPSHIRPRFSSKLLTLQLICQSFSLFPRLLNPLCPGVSPVPTSGVNASADVGRCPRAAIADGTTRELGTRLGWLDHSGSWLSFLSSRAASHLLHPCTEDPLFCWSGFRVSAYNRTGCHLQRTR